MAKTYLVDGMTCGGCSSSVTKAIEGLGSGVKVSIELESKKVISYVAEDAGEVLGFVSGGYERQGDYVYNGEIYALYVLKNYQRQGVGTKLVSTLAKQLNQFSIYSMLVRVLEHNPYRRFYEKVNGIYLRKHHMPFAGELLNVAAYGWIDSSLTYH